VTEVRLPHVLIGKACRESCTAASVGIAATIDLLLEAVGVRLILITLEFGNW
jgi:hypothetical protein